ncbi:hypothetical protein GCM10010347_58990 [Streptomyces cirratus]|uniref:Uncharacterized protein n=1 Tax=Streptomyces cirratus TaxID=68187 RepID=A0ABQ3F523_9ACTN|nr:hypothetical protein GCM10010347_58990 [Streptomyces cirratus]
MRSAADFETPNSGASCRIVRSVLRYVATSTERSSGPPTDGSPAPLHPPHVVDNKRFGRGDQVFRLHPLPDLPPAPEAGRQPPDLVPVTGMRGRPAGRPTNCRESGPSWANGVEHRVGLA